MTLTEKEREILKDYLSLLFITLNERNNDKQFENLEIHKLIQFSKDLQLLTDIYKRL